MDSTIQIPQKILDQYARLCELVEKSEYGSIDARLVAKYMGCDY